MFMSNVSDQEIKPHKESNQDKGDQDSYQQAEPIKKPNEVPEQPMREQK